MADAHVPPDSRLTPIRLTSQPWDDAAAFAVLVLLRVIPGALTEDVGRRAAAYVSECAADPDRVGRGCVVRLVVGAVAAHNELNTDLLAYRAEVDRLTAAFDYA